MKPGARSSLRDLFELQRVLVADALNRETKPADKAKCAQAWERLEERKRILRNRPLPGSLKPQPPKPKRSGLLAMPMDDYVDSSADKPQPASTAGRENVPSA